MAKSLLPISCKVTIVKQVLLLEQAIRFCLADKQDLRLSMVKPKKMIRKAIYNKQDGIMTEVQFPTGIKLVNWLHKQDLFFLQAKIYNFIFRSNVNLSVDYLL